MANMMAVSSMAIARIEAPETNVVGIPVVIAEDRSTPDQVSADQMLKTAFCCLRSTVEVLF